MIQNFFTKDLEFNINFPGNHLSWWTKNKLKNVLKEVGFKEIKFSAFGQSLNYLLRDTNYFDNTYPQISLYVEAKK